MAPDSTVSHSVELVVEYDDPDVAALVAAAVAQEIGEIDGDRTTAGICHEADTVTVEIDAADLVALRAGLNTWGTLIEVAERTADVAATDGTAPGVE